MRDLTGRTNNRKQAHMTGTYKYYRIALLSIILAGMLSIYPSKTDCEIVTHAAIKKDISFETVKFPQSFTAVDICNTYMPSENRSKPELNPMIIAGKNENTGSSYKENTSTRLGDILGKYYNGATSSYEEIAFKRVLKWKEDFEDIAKDYSHVNWKILAAIVKAETQGKTGQQISSAMAVGMPQIKYQGAWAFFWDAMFSKKITRNSLIVKDYYNAGIRSRYDGQLNRIRQYLEEEGILITPPELPKSALAYRQARSNSWENLKIHLRRDYEPGEYQVAVDIAAMYIDHLIDTFYKIRRQVIEIKQYIEQNRIASIDDIQVSGTKSIRLRRIKNGLVKSPEHTASGNVRERALIHINNILNRFEDPNIYSSAYNFGLRNVLDYIHSGKNWPKSIEEYVKKVATYNTIFMEIEKFSVYI